MNDLRALYVTLVLLCVRDSTQTVNVNIQYIYV